MIVVDATHLERTLFVVGQARQLGLPTIVAVNMSDIAQKQGIRVDCQALAKRLACPVIPISARTGAGLDDLQNSILSICTPPDETTLPIVSDEPCDSCGTCPYADGYRWAATLANESTHTGKRASREFTDFADRLLTHRLLGTAVFAAVMLTVFASVFWVAQYPMELLDGGIGALAEFVLGCFTIGGPQQFADPRRDWRRWRRPGVLATDLRPVFCLGDFRRLRIPCPRGTGRGRMDAASGAARAGFCPTAGSSRLCHSRDHVNARDRKPS